MCLFGKKQKHYSGPQTVMQRGLAERIIYRYDTKVINNSGVPIYMVITPRPIYNINSLSINRIGSLSLETDGEYHAQEIKIGRGRSKSISLDSQRFYVTSFLMIDGEWKRLWNCREFSSSGYIVFQKYHQEEARLTAPGDKLVTYV